MVLGNRRLTILELVDMVGMAFKHVKQCFLTIKTYKQIITVDESWIYAYDPKITDQ